MHGVFPVGLLGLSVNVRRRLLAAAAIVTQLVTRSVQGEERLRARVCI